MPTTSRTATCVTPESPSNGAPGIVARTPWSGSGARSSRALPAVVAALSLLTACEGDTGPAGPPGPPGPPGDGGGVDPDELTPTEYEVGEAVPELVARIESVSGASGPAGEFLVGDVVTLEFALEKSNGAPWKLEELAEGEVLVS